MIPIGSGQKLMKPVLLHIPHASLIIPDEARADFIISAEEVDEELLKLTDRYTDDLFDLESAERLVFGVSRFVVDPERFDEDTKEPMAERGMGAVYMRTTSGAPLRSGCDRESLIATYYAPHHKKLNEWAEKAIKEHGRCLLIDCHSYPSQPLPCDQDQSLQRPMFCVGTDPYNTPPYLTDLVVGLLSEVADRLGASYSEGAPDAVLVDHPYSGTMVPSQFYGLDPRVESVMIEVNRSLYMDEATGEKRASFADLKASLSELLSAVAESWEIDFREETWARVPPSMLETIAEKCAEMVPPETISPKNVFNAIVKMGGGWSLHDFLSFAMEGAVPAWKRELLMAAADYDNDSALCRLAKDLLEEVSVWNETGTHLAGGHEFGAEVYWVDVPGLGVANVAVLGGDEFQVLKVRRGKFDEARRKRWLEKSIESFYESQQDEDTESDDRGNG